MIVVNIKDFHVTKIGSSRLSAAHGPSHGIDRISGEAYQGTV